MASSNLKQAILATVFGIALPALAVAQGAPTPTPAPSAEETELSPQELEMQEWYVELEQLHTQLETLQNQALADETLATRQEALGEEIRLAMEAQDSTTATQLGRMSTLEAEAMAAQEANDLPRLQELMVEANGIQEHLMTLQQQIVEEPAMAAKLDLFQTDLQQKMLQLNPNAQQIIDRYRELEEKLTAAMGAGL